MKQQGKEYRLTHFMKPVLHSSQNETKHLQKGEQQANLLYEH
jgi:hypothetical protein